MLRKDCEPSQFQLTPAFVDNATKNSGIVEGVRMLATGRAPLRNGRPLHFTCQQDRRPNPSERHDGACLLLWSVGRSFSSAGLKGRFYQPWAKPRVSQELPCHVIGAAVCSGTGLYCGWPFRPADLCCVPNQRVERRLSRDRQNGTLDQILDCLLTLLDSRFFRLKPKKSVPITSHPQSTGGLQAASGTLRQGASLPENYRGVRG